jgi:hypothetical protein
VISSRALAFRGFFFLLPVALSIGLFFPKTPRLSFEEGDERLSASSDLLPLHFLLETRCSSDRPDTTEGGRQELF